MEETKLEKQGRVLIPKKIREKLNLRSGEKMSIGLKEDKIILKPLRSIKDIKNLKGCVKGSKIDPLKLKTIWEM